MPENLEHHRKHSTHPLRHAVNKLMLAEPLVSLSIVLLELLHDVRANIRVHLLDTLSNLQGVFRRDRVLTLAEKLLYEVSDVATGDGNVLDGRTDDVTFGLILDIEKSSYSYDPFPGRWKCKLHGCTYHRNDVGDAISRVNDSTR